MFEVKAVDRVVDFASVVLISVAAVLTALCGYQSGLWGERQTRLYNVANANRVLSAEAGGRANTLTTIDVTLFLHYIDAINSADTRNAQFIYRSFRPEMRPAMKAWLATDPLKNLKAPSSPFVMPEYTLAARATAQKYDTVAAANFEAAENAASNADGFLLLTVVFAGVSFLAGMSTKMVYPRHAVVTVVGILALIYGLVRLVRLPFL
jgi:hypothetical protein